MTGRSSIGASRGVVHDIRCADQCQGEDAIESRRVVADHGEVFEGPDELAAHAKMICRACGKAAMNVVYRPFAMGTRRSGVTRLGDGTVVTSPDDTVCAAGRSIIGPGGFTNLQPGESKQVGIGPIGFEATRSPMGGEVQLRRTDI